MYLFLIYAVQFFVCLLFPSFFIPLPFLFLFLFFIYDDFLFLPLYFFLSPLLLSFSLILSLPIFLHLFFFFFPSGKAAKQAIDIFTRGKECSATEKSFLKSLNDPEMVAILLGDIKINMPGLYQVKRAKKGKK